MPEVEKRFRALLSAAKFSWVPDPLPETCEHPNSAAVDTSCGLYVEGMLTNKTQLQELVMFLDQHYQEIYEQQVIGMEAPLLPWLAELCVLVLDSSMLALALSVLLCTVIKQLHRALGNDNPYMITHVRNDSVGCTQGCLVCGLQS